MWYIELPCSYYPKDVMAQRDAGIDKEPLIADCEVRTATFYHIDFVDSFTDDDGKEYSMIHSNGETLICILKPEVVNKLIISHSLRLI